MLTEMSLGEVNRTVVDFAVAAADTTATTTVWTMHLLATEHEHREKVQTLFCRR